MGAYSASRQETGLLIPSVNDSLSDKLSAMRDDIATSLAGHRERNVHLAALIREKGARLDEPRVIECHFWASSQNAAEQLAKALQAKGFVKLQVTQSEGNLWNVEMATTQSVNDIVSEGFTVDMVETAATFDGSFDGWGTSI